MKIRAAVLHSSPVSAPFAQSRPLRIEELDLASPGRDEVLVRVRAAGLCHSDLSVIDGNRLRPVPMVLGHEAAGEVVETGEGVGDLRGQSSPGVGELDPARPAQEQRRAGPLLQHLDLVADRRLRHAEFSRRPGERPMPRHRLEGADGSQRRQLNSAHG